MIIILGMTFISCQTLTNINEPKRFDYVGSWKIEDKSSLDLMTMSKDSFFESYQEISENGSVISTITYEGKITQINPNELKVENVIIKKYDSENKLIEKEVNSEIVFSYTLSGDILKVQFQSHDFYHYYQRVK